MQVKNSYYYFKEALTPEECQRIIDQGTKQISESKNSGIDVSATTVGNNSKHALES